jgi:hypothetical protein
MEVGSDLFLPRLPPNFHHPETAAPSGGCLATARSFAFRSIPQQIQRKKYSPGPITTDAANKASAVRTIFFIASLFFAAFRFRAFGW